MAFRSGAVAKIQSTTVAQPLVGSWITASGYPMVGASSIPLVLTLGTATDNSAGTDATDFFRVGDPALLIDPNGANAEKCQISSIAATGNQLTLGPQNDNSNYVIRNPHVAGAFGTGSFICLAGQYNNVYLDYEDGGTGQWIYLGNSIAMTAVYRRMAKVSKVAANSNPFYWAATENFFGSPFDVSELWVLGTSVNDLFNVSLGVL